MCDATPRAAIELPQSLRAPEIARRFIADHTCLTHNLPPVDSAILLVSEATTNAVLYGTPPIVLALDCTGEASEIRVRDGSDGQPVLNVADLDDVHGRGMLLIDILSDAWGVESTEPGKEVWFLLRP